MGECKYVIEVLTSDVKGSGTDARVSVVIFGEKGDTGKIPLENSADNFERGKADVFHAECADVDLQLHRSGGGHLTGEGLDPGLQRGRGHDAELVVAGGEGVAVANLGQQGHYPARPRLLHPRRTRPQHLEPGRPDPHDAHQRDGPGERHGGEHGASPRDHHRLTERDPDAEDDHAGHCQMGRGSRRVDAHTGRMALR